MTTHKRQGSKPATLREAIAYAVLSVCLAISGYLLINDRVFLAWMVGCAGVALAAAIGGGYGSKGGD